MNSKGVPFKNRKLFEYTAKSIPKQYINDTYVFTDDDVINDYAQNHAFKTASRSPASAADESTTKEMMEDFCSHFTDNDFVVMLYLTYPNRDWADVDKAIIIFEERNLSSLLCRKEAKQTPYLMMFDRGDGTGEQVVKHNFSRRQDYRECFELSHYISIILPSELEKLNNNLYNDTTYFMKIDEALDIDTEEDLQCILK